MADEMPANTPLSDSTASTPDTDLHPDVVADAAARLAPCLLYTSPSPRD